MERWGRGEWFAPGQEPSPGEQQANDQHEHGIGAPQEDESSSSGSGSSTEVPEWLLGTSGPTDTQPLDLSAASADTWSEGGEPIARLSAESISPDGTPPADDASALPSGYPGVFSPLPTAGDQPTVTMSPAKRIRRRSVPLAEAGTISDPYATPVSAVALSPTQAAVGTAAGVFQRFYGTAIPGRTRTKAHDRRSRYMALILGGAAILVSCICAGLLVDPFFERGGFPFGLGQQQVTQTAYAPSASPGNLTPKITGTPSPTHTGGGGGGPHPTTAPTPTPLPIGATVQFFVASQTVNSPGAMTACSSNCDIGGQEYSNTQNYTGGPYQSTLVPQTQLSGTIKAVNNGTTTWSNPNYSFSGGGFTCNPVPVLIPAHTSTTFTCTINAPSPNVINAHTITGTVAGTQVTYDNPQPLSGNGHWQVTSVDCQNAWADVEKNKAGPGERQWLNGQVPSGWQLGNPSPSVSYGALQCPKDQFIQNFNVSLNATIQDGAFNPADAQNLALSRFNNSIPNGFVLKPGTSPSTCTPQNTSYDASKSRSNLTCSDSGTVIYNWTDSLKTQLATSIEGQTQAQAQTTCNTNYAGQIQANSCKVTIANSDTVPNDLSKIAIQANIP